MVITISEEQGSRGKTLLELLREAGCYTDAPCGGNGICGKCRIRYREGAGSIHAKEQELFTEQELLEGWRLACLSVPKGACKVQFEEAAVESIVAENIMAEHIKKTGGENGEENIEKNIQKNYGVAVDIGTTTLAAVLVEKETQKVSRSAAAVNHQRAYGADVISRVQASNHGKKAELAKCIRGDILSLLKRLAEEEGIALKQITEMVLAGNTVMCHLLLGYSSEGLGSAPFEPVSLSMEKRTAQELFGEELSEEEAGSFEVTVLPGIAAFVGADITAGIFSSGMLKQRSLLLDIGTNGEMALFTGEKLITTSVAAGPAFEGGNISCGMPGVPGAIERAVLYGKERMVTQTIGKSAPIGLCGTGIIDVMYELLRHRLVDSHGTLREPWFESGFPVVAGKIFFCQEDIRQIQMAKAAVRAGIEVLARESGLSFSQIEAVYLAGGFGVRLQAEKAFGIGLLPELFRGKVTAVGNSSLAGAKECVFHPDIQKEMTRIAKNASVINLAEHPDFLEAYMNNMNF